MSADQRAVVEEELKPLDFRPSCVQVPCYNLVGEPNPATHVLHAVCPRCSKTSHTPSCVECWEVLSGLSRTAGIHFHCTGCNLGLGELERWATLEPLS